MVVITGLKPLPLITVCYLLFTTHLEGGVVNKFQTSNKITVLHQEVKKLPIITITIFVYGGNIYENKRHYGITSLMASLITKGTKTRTAEQIAVESENIGTSISVGTDKDFATVGISVIKKHLPKAMELLSDVIINPTFPEKEFLKEKTMMLASIRSRKDRIFTVADDLTNQIFFSGHPYSVPEVGTESTVKKIKREDVVMWHKKLFTTQNILISVAGDITLQETTELIEKNFASLPDGPKVEPRKSEIKFRKREIAQKHDFKQAYLMLSYPACKVGEKDYAVLKVLVATLGGRMSGRLFKELREKLSLAYEVNAFYPTQLQYGKFTFYIGVDAKNLDIARDGIYSIINEIKKNGISEKELDETKNYLKGVYLLQRQTVEKKSWYNGFWEVMGLGWRYDERYLRELLSVSTEDLKSAANKYFSPDKEVLVKVIPKKTR